MSRWIKPAQHPDRDTVVDIEELLIGITLLDSIPEVIWPVSCNDGDQHNPL
jgi:hypothetical protein